MNRLVRQIAFLLLILPFGGCIHAPRLSETALPLKSASELQAQLEGVIHRYHSLQTSAKMEVVTEKETYVASQLLFVQRPAQLRSEILFGPFATPVLSLTVDKEKLSVYQPLQGKFSEGNASVANISRFTRMPLRIEDLVGMILLSPPQFPFEEISASRVGAGDLLVLVADGGVEQHFTFDDSGNLLQAAYFLAGRLQLQADYADFDMQQDNFPQQLKIAMPERQVSAAMTFSDSMVNKPIPSKNFSLKVPPGIKVQRLP